MSPYISFCLYVHASFTVDTETDSVAPLSSELCHDHQFGVGQALPKPFRARAPTMERVGSIKRSHHGSLRRKPSEHGSSATTPTTPTMPHGRPVVVRYSVRKASITPSLKQIQQILVREVRLQYNITLTLCDICTHKRSLTTSRSFQVWGNK